MTEMLRIFLSGRPGAVRPGTAGVAVPGYGPRILGGEGNEVAPGIPGMLLVRGGSPAAGAAGNAATSGRC
jgi:benzoate-CoA ligase